MRDRCYKSYLVGGFNPSEKYSSVGMVILNIWKNKNVWNHQPVMTGKTLLLGEPKNKTDQGKCSMNSMEGTPNHPTYCDLGSLPYMYIYSA